MEYQVTERAAVNSESPLGSGPDPGSRLLPQSKTGTPLCSFENNSDYVYDVQWSPTHPAVFASVDGEGRLDFWNINTDIEVGFHCSLSQFLSPLVFARYLH